MKPTMLLRAFYIFHLDLGVGGETKRLVCVIYFINKKQIHGSGTEIKE